MYVVNPSVWIFHRHLSFKGKLLVVMLLTSDDLNVVKGHLMMTFVEIARNFKTVMSIKKPFLCTETCIFSDRLVWP